MQPAKIILLTGAVMAAIFSFTYYYRDIQAFFGYFEINGFALTLLFITLSLAGLFVSSMIGISLWQT